MRVPPPFPYQGSKRALAPAILLRLPRAMERLVEPFAGSAALSLACAAQNRAQACWLNDANAPLAALLERAIRAPDDLAAAYEHLWLAYRADPAGGFQRVRDAFNRAHDPAHLLYLLARCVKAAVRYNAAGAFNQSPDQRRLGARPATMRANLRRVAQLLHGRATVTARDYRAVLAEVRASDVVYLDPPYQGVSGGGDARYVGGVPFGEFVAELAALNRRGVRFAVSYDGRCGARVYGEPLPASLGLTSVELAAGRSAQATLLGRRALTIETLHLSAPLAAELAA